MGSVAGEVLGERGVGGESGANSVAGEGAVWQKNHCNVHCTVSIHISKFISKLSYVSTSYYIITFWQ